MAKLPPHNQRRLNVRIAEEYPGRYTDWYEMAREMQERGATLEMIRARFAALGVKVSIFTVHNWIKERERMHAA